MASVRLKETTRNMLDEVVRAKRLAGEDCSISSITEEALEKWGIRKEFREARKIKKKLLTIM